MSQVQKMEKVIASAAEILREIIEQGFNRGNYPALDILVSEQFAEHQPGMHADREGLKQDIQFLRRAFPDLHLTIEEIIEVGDRAWARSTARGTNLGPMMGPPTGKTIEIAVFDEIRVKDGWLVEHWGVPDRFAMLQQLGRLPA